MRKCKIHQYEHNYTCPFCEAALCYVSRTHLIDYFNAGVMNDKNLATTNEEHEAYEYGHRLRCRLLSNK